MASKTSEHWWAAVKADPERLMDWLRKQYHGERTAVDRIERFCVEALGDADDAMTRRRRGVLRLIMDQEARHAGWVGELLRARGEEPRLLTRRERYWEQTLAAIGSFEDACAVASLAETMRLERIRVIAADADAPADVRAAFARILPDEEFHARAFTRLAGEAALARARAAHDRGAAAIGFIPS